MTPAEFKQARHTLGLTIAGTALFLAIALSGCSTVPGKVDASFVDAAREAHASGGELTVWNNYGGSVAEMGRVLQLVRDGLRVRIVGDCASACTYFLIARENVCYEPSATFAFHAPSGAAGQKSEPYTRGFSHPLAARLLDDRALSSYDMTTYTAAEIAALDYEERYCNG